ncbi:MAG TPA: DegT/DnrJ/EryC1/StrS family aminotransferase, partial [Chitinophagaceae bacterium]|nr:DegT/DnrJ/EryC1/StrS family aminotransferase [Chitinophagaceae bacterium]
SIGLAQLAKLDELQEIRGKIWNIYSAELGKEDWIICPPGPESHETHSYFTYAIRTPNRDKLAKYLYSKGIYTTLRYPPLHLNKMFQTGSSLPNCEILNEEALNIPLHPNLSMDDVDHIIESIKKFK